MDVSGENFSPVQPVAIVGVALRFPGALDALSFHDLTLSSRRLFQLGCGPGPSGITPCHALAAEAAAAAIADTGLDRDWARGDLAKRGRPGVIVANCPPVPTVPAPLVPPIGAWVEQRLGLAGPVPSGQWLSPQEMAVSAIGCSLRAVATACEALTRGEFDLMLAGGVAVGSGGDPGNPDIRVYDANPTGIAPGEGCGMVVLMRAADARAAGLPAYAEIAGWSTPEDGPDLRTVIRAAYLRAGVDPADVQLVEGHGAATAADDQAELAALLDVLDRADRAGGTGRAGARGGCALGSVAANLGDTRGAAGVAALLAGHGGGDDPAGHGLRGAARAAAGAGRDPQAPPDGRGMARHQGPAGGRQLPGARRGVRDGPFWRVAPGAPSRAGCPPARPQAPCRQRARHSAAGQRGARWRPRPALLPLAACHLRAGTAPARHPAPAPVAPGLPAGVPAAHRSPARLRLPALAAAAVPAVRQPAGRRVTSSERYQGWRPRRGE
jgi:Beta-ketoacyl synthase, C-terminal domain/Beta-ketoacyl synthase, N-terminal domain